jgi:hypothetical protein
LHIVKGDYDTEASTLALSKVVQHGSLRIGFTHGHTIIPHGDADALLIAARQMDVDVLLWGGTHKFEAYELEGKFFINPGSATGAFSTSWQAVDEEPTPSFCLMDVRNCDTFVWMCYSLIPYRFKAMCLCCMFINYGRMQTGTRTSQWKRCLSENRHRQKCESTTSTTSR